MAMMARSTLTLLLVSTAAPAFAAENLQAHAEAPRKTVILSRAKIVPEAVELKASEVLQFENLSADSVTVRFIEPKNQEDKIRCEFLKGEPKAPWLLFSWDYEKRLIATIPPGRMASVCSFTAGEYSYTVARTFKEDAGGPSGVLPMKGTLSVK
jgi:hypothetical protein